VQCAVEVQTLLDRRNVGIAADQRVSFRIGINIGDVIVEPHDIYGDGVNIAARLEALAEPGGICVSLVVRDQVGGRINVIFEDLGEQRVKNVDRPLRVFRVRPVTSSRGAPITETESRFDQEASAHRNTPSPDKPSLAVLPFGNWSSDPEQEFLTDGIVEDIITALSRYPSLFVIARNSSFVYKGRSVDVKQVGHDLGVRYVVEGSLRKSGQQIRVTAQLIEADTGKHLWAGRYDRDLSDVFAIQDGITEAITIAVAPTIDAAERRRALHRVPESLDAWSAYQQGRWHSAKVNAASNDVARRLFELAVEFDPTFVAAYAELAAVWGYAGIHYKTIPLDQALRLSLEYARKAVELDPTDAHALTELSRALFWHGDLDTSMTTARQAIAINPNCANAYFCLGVSLIYGGLTTEGRLEVAAATRLSPFNQRDHYNAEIDIVLAESYYYDNDYEKCVSACRSRISNFPGLSRTYGLLAAALGQLYRVDEARAAFSKYRDLLGSEFKPQIAAPYRRADHHRHLLDGLRKAGWRE
jgi:adenylate cyclase